MKISTIVLLALLLVPIAGFAQSFSGNFIPPSISVNTMSITSFDPDDRDSQPPLSTLFVSNAGAPQRIQIKVRVVWNSLTLAEADFTSIDSIATGENVVSFESRDLISNEGIGGYTGSENLSIDSILDSPTFGDAVMGGYFPDGNLQIRVWLRPYSSASWNVPESSTGDATFTIVVRNAGNITLLSPGATIGQNPPSVSGAPLSFYWNTMNTGFNEFELTIREYPQSQIPTVNNVENTGYLLYQTPEEDSAESGFSDYLAFTPGKYYAWRVRSKLFTEFSYYVPPTPTRARTTSPNLSSNWFVFQYVDESNASSGVSELQALLNLLGNNELRNIYNSGFNTVGTIIYEGRSYSGQDALDLVESLMGKEIQVRIQD